MVIRDKRVGLSGKQNKEFEELALPLLDSLYNFAHWLTHNREEAEDLVQETYAKALRGFSGFALGTNFRAWMFRILRNAFLNSRTGLAARMTVPLLEDEAALPPAAVVDENPETLLVQRMDSEALQRAIEGLPVHYREVLLLCDVEEMRYADAA